MESILYFDTLSLEEKNNFLQKKLKEVIDENNSLKERLKNYTNPDRKKKYYQENREKILQKHKEITAEKRAEYNKKAYEKKKEKIEQLQQIQNNIQTIFLNKLNIS
jgi:DNA anti-recombination protein RmuC